MAPRKPTRREPAACRQGSKRPAKRVPTAAWASSLGAATTQASGTQRATWTQPRGQEVPSFFFSEGTMEGAKTGVPRPAPAPCPVAVPRLHSLGSRCGGRGGPAAVTSRRSILCQVRRGGALQEPLHGDLHVARDTPAPLGQRSDADLAAICQTSTVGRSPVCGAINRTADVLTAASPAAVSNRGSRRRRGDNGRRPAPRTLVPPPPSTAE
ncbi:hypothetical protein HPB52_019461 [Rhipicephalus sanguineus]|uniref:Uncharacterized protein n=1 Tax=Rhipicephalus sanguineus TaxID=34632 RepID=A0A9D4Q874_RHISA|nr:hypothetical protein HPB52_019461 [Rhipicephalus sanguineus]